MSDTSTPSVGRRQAAIACEEPLRELDGFIAAPWFMSDGLFHEGSHDAGLALRSVAGSLRLNAIQLRKALGLGATEEDTDA